MTACMCTAHVYVKNSFSMLHKSEAYILLLGALPLNPHWGSAPGPQWGTKVPQTP